jgi:hypothetical protein
MFFLYAVLFLYFLFRLYVIVFPNKVKVLNPFGLQHVQPSEDEDSEESEEKNKVIDDEENKVSGEEENKESDEENKQNEEDTKEEINKKND